MGWPQLDDFRWAMQEPANCFSDPELQAGEVVCDMFGMPKMASGNFACVYEIHGNNRRWAVRTFNHEVTDQQVRYQLVSEHLGVVGLPYMVRFQFQPQGILVGGGWYPIVKMSWVEGMTLTRWVKEHREEPDKIRDLAKDWRGMIGALYGLQVAHADIQQGNVLITKDDMFKLVDYDGMFVPSMQGKPAPELGHPNWNHPKRTPDTFGPYLDQFPGLVGYLSLLAISAQPELMDEFCNDENLILSQTDFSAPRNSAALHQLKTIDEHGVRELTEALIDWCEHEVNYDTLESLATGGASSDMMRTATRAASARMETQSRLESEARSEARSSSRRQVVYIAAGVAVALGAAAWLMMSGPDAGPASSDTGTTAASATDAPSAGTTPGDAAAAANAADVNAQPSAADEQAKALPPAGSPVEDEIAEKTTAPSARPATPAPSPATAAQPKPADGASAAPTESFEFPNASGYFDRGKRREADRDLVGAESDFTKALAMSPNEPMFYRERGNIRLRKDDLIGARLDYDKAIELDPRFSAAYNSRGVLRKRQGDLVGSRADYDRAIALNPVEATYFRNRGNLRRQQGDLKGSLEDYDRAIELDGKDSIAFNSRALVRETLNNDQGALADYDKAIELNPNEPSFFQNRSNLKRMMGDLKGAQADLDRAVALRTK